MRFELSTVQPSEGINTVLADEVTRGIEKARDDGDTVLAQYAPVDTVLKLKADYVYSRH
ncbi:hypothetical protein C4K25_3731 [Pseudomonas chlororaphis]|nr:hypothetical protein C4K25_3731 [Pseudomonas chlororaphis]